MPIIYFLSLAATLPIISAEMAIRAPGGAKLMAAPSDSAKISRLVPDNALVYTEKEEGDWISIFWFGYRGWIGKKYLADAKIYDRTVNLSQTKRMPTNPVIGKYLIANRDIVLPNCTILAGQVVKATSKVHPDKSTIDFEGVSRPCLKAKGTTVASDLLLLEDFTALKAFPRNISLRGGAGDWGFEMIIFTNGRYLIYEPAGTESKPLPNKYFSGKMLTNGNILIPEMKDLNSQNLYTVIVSESGKLRALYDDSRENSGP